VEEAAATLERNGADPANVERASTRRVLLAARGRASGAGVRSWPQTADRLKLNGQERALCKRARIVCVRVLLAGVRARVAAVAAQVAYRDGIVGGRSDAFRRTYWNACMVQSVGEQHAKAWGDAHECGSPKNQTTPGARRPKAT
jgi:hypothetical protein